MYKINTKAIVVVFILQVLTGVAWYASTPTAFLGRAGMDFVKQSSPSMMVLFALSTLVYLVFISWILGKVKGFSGIGRFFLVIAIYLFVVVPNYMIVLLHLNVSTSDVLYILSLGAANSTIAAIILPLWRSSRSIFKD